MLTVCTGLVASRTEQRLRYYRIWGSRVQGKKITEIPEENREALDHRRFPKSWVLAQVQSGTGGIRRRPPVTLVAAEASEIRNQS